MIRKITFSAPPSTSVLSVWNSLCHFNPPSWIFLKEKLYECWMCFYGPVFWIMYMLTCSLELNRAKKESSIAGMTFSPSEDSLHYGNNDNYDQPLKSGSIKEDSNFNSEKYAKSQPVRKTKTNNDDDLRSIRSSKSFRRTIKVHLRAIRQKQQSLNDVMRRSLLRRASKISLVQAPLSFHHSDRHTMTVMKPSTSLPTHALTESPPPPSSLSSPFKLSSSSPAVQQSLYGSKMKYIHPLILDRRASLSDSLLKSINMKRKRPPAALIPSSNQHFCNSNFLAHEDPVCLSHPSTSPLPELSSLRRRRITPEIISDRRNIE